MNAVLRSTGAIAATAVALLALTACSKLGSGLQASSSCEDYLAASAAEQDSAVSKIAGEVGAPNAVTPLGRPNIDYLCASSPALTLGEAIEATG